MVAVAKDELEVVQILLDQGVNVNQKYHQGVTALHLAAVHNVPIFEALIYEGANVRALQEMLMNMQIQEFDEGIMARCQSGGLKNGTVQYNRALMCGLKLR